MKNLNQLRKRKVNTFKRQGNAWIKKKKKKTSKKGSIDLSNAKNRYNKNGVIDTWLIDENNNGIYEISYVDMNEMALLKLLQSIKMKIISK